MKTVKGKSIIVGWFIFVCSLWMTVQVEANDWETDRVIVKQLDDEGNEVIESIPIVEYEQLVTQSSSTEEQVKLIEPDYIRSIDAISGSLLESNWGLARMGVRDMLRNMNPSLGTQLVAILDTGIDYRHPLLKDRVVAGYDFVDQDEDPMDMQYHGTHVAGIIAEATPKQVSILPIRVLDAKGNGYDYNVAKGIYYAVDRGATIINMSFGGERYSKYLAEAIAYAQLNGVLVVVSAGNEGKDVASYYPSSDERVIVVSATDQLDRVATFSNTGKTIDLAAPGVQILSSIPNNRYARMDGTSMATPFVSAAAALLSLNHPDLKHTEVEQLLKRFVDDKGPRGWDPLYGAGIVNVRTYNYVKVANGPKPVAHSIALPRYDAVPLDKEWTITFNRVFSDATIVSIHLYRDFDEVPVTIYPKLEDKEIVVVPDALYEPGTDYRLQIVVKKGKTYHMDFSTQ